jgi:hypothetical protein
VHDILSILVLAAHLLAMNVATAAPLVCIWLKRREVRSADDTAGRLGRFLAWQSIIGLLLGMAVGLLATWLLWKAGDEKFFEALAAVPRRRLWFGLIELAFFLVLMVWYAWAWPRVRRPTLWHPALALLAATDLIYHFPPLFAAITVLQSRASLPAQELSYTGFLAVMLASETLARVLHFLLASLVVTGSLMILYARRLAMEGSEDAGRCFVWGARCAFAAGALQLLAGGYLLVSLPAGKQQRLMGGDWLATGLLAASVLGVFALLHSLAPLALGEANRRDAVRSLWLTVFIVLAMTAARHVTSI